MTLPGERCRFWGRSGRVPSTALARALSGAVAFHFSRETVAAVN